MHFISHRKSTDSEATDETPVPLKDSSNSGHS